MSAHALPWRAVFEANDRDDISSFDVNKISAPVWIEKSVEFAQRYAYAAPVSPGKRNVMLTREYETMHATSAVPIQHLQQSVWRLLDGELT